jgi:hypothetical protein
VGYFYYFSDRSSLGKTVNETVSKANGVKPKLVKATEKPMKQGWLTSPAITRERPETWASAALLEL